MIREKRRANREYHEFLTNCDLRRVVADACCTPSNNNTLSVQDSDNNWDMNRVAEIKQYHRLSLRTASNEHR